ncbi:MAG: VOC family protein [Clostridiales bacterium]|nr:VOC family protein [Clostridiales bacterium]
MAKSFSFGGFASGEIFQLGYVVPDVDAAMKFYAEQLGVGPFSCSRGFRAPDGWYRGKTDMPELTLAQAYTGHVVVELIQQHDDTPSVYKEFIDRCGYGLHHYGITVATEDYDRTLEFYYSRGFVDVFTDNLPGGTRIRYIGPKSVGDIEKTRAEAGAGYFECVEVLENQEKMFSRLCEAHRLWDGKTVILAP